MDVQAAADAIRRAPFRPPFWLRSAHAQTLVGALLPRIAPRRSQAWLVEPETGTRLLCRGDAAPASPATVLLVHGLGGSDASGHMLDIARCCLERGLSVVRMNMRNCGGTEHLTPTLYHANLTQDLHAVVEDAIARRGARRLILASYSVGANLVLNTLARWGSQPPSEVLGAVLLCPAIDIACCVDRVDAPGNGLYRRHFVKQLSRLYVSKSSRYPRAFQPRRIADVRTLRDFDRLATAAEAGFSDVEAFYAWVSAAGRLGQIRVPTLLLHALDDPMVVLLPETRAAILANPCLALVDSAAGGHCGFFEALSVRRIPGLWAADHLARTAAVWALEKTGSDRTRIDASVHPTWERADGPRAGYKFDRE